MCLSPWVLVIAKDLEMEGSLFQLPEDGCGSTWDSVSRLLRDVEELLGECLGGS